jgi:hypothetical protein
MPTNRKETPPSMATVMTKVDDFDHQSPAAETIEFTFDGTTYEIDLNETNAHDFRTTMARYTDCARPAGSDAEVAEVAEPTPELAAVPTPKPAATPSRGRKHVAATRSTKPRAANDVQTRTAIRAWAVKAGMGVPTRGRLPGAIIDAFNKAHGIG